jgi:hypothetical protein
MSCTLYVQRPESRIKVAFRRVLPSSENVIVHDVPFLNDQVKITIDDIVEGCKHVIVSFPTDDKEWIGDLIQTPLIWPIELVQLVEPVIK